SGAQGTIRAAQPNHVGLSLWRHRLSVVLCRLWCELHSARLRHSRLRSRLAAQTERREPSQLDRGGDSARRDTDLADRELELDRPLHRPLVQPRCLLHAAIALTLHAGIESRRADDRRCRAIAVLIAAGRLGSRECVDRQWLTIGAEIACLSRHGREADGFLIGLTKATGQRQGSGPESDPTQSYTHDFSTRSYGNEPTLAASGSSGKTRDSKPASRWT